MARLIGIFLIIFACFPVFADEKALTIVYPPEKNKFHDAAAEIVRQGYAKLGISVSFKVFPAERALFMSNAGKSDGELVRIAGIEDRYPNLIRIPVSHVAADQMAFAADREIEVNGWQSLSSRKLAFHRGYKLAEQKTIGMNRYLTASAQNAFKMVEHGRAEIAIANRFTGQKTISDLGLRKIIMLKPPLQTDPLFHYLHKKHSSLVKEITRVFLDMEEQGVMAKIRTQFGVD